MIYNPFEYRYYGTTEPRVAIITMGSSVKVVEGTLKYLKSDAKKSSGWTILHLRFSSDVPIEAPFRVEEGQAGYVACHNEGYVPADKFDVV